MWAHLTPPCVRFELSFLNQLELMSSAEPEQRRRDRAAQVDHRNRSEEKRRQLEAITFMQR
jgi:hypothetical protein